jgi:hypothetical protein
MTGDDTLSHRKMRRVRVRMRVWISSSDSNGPAPCTAHPVYFRKIFKGFLVRLSGCDAVFMMTHVHTSVGSWWDFKKDISKGKRKQMCVTSWAYSNVSLPEREVQGQTVKDGR